MYTYVYMCMCLYKTKQDSGFTSHVNTEAGSSVPSQGGSMGVTMRGGTPALAGVSGGDASATASEGQRLVAYLCDAAQARPE